MVQINDGSPDGGGRRRRRFLSASEKYEIWLALLRGEVTTREAADRVGVDRSTILKLRQVAKEGALAALAASSQRPLGSIRTPGTSSASLAGSGSRAAALDRPASVVDVPGVRHQRAVIRHSIRWVSAFPRR